jgi:diguanylate cyclase (GGDEF)-like protein
MLGLGVAVGVAFPFVLPPLGIPSDLTLRPTFFAATLVAGLMLAAMNHQLARRVVGGRLRALSGQMRHVAEVIADATYSGDWARCSPEECQLDVDSEDELGDAAASFNELINALAASRHVQQAMSDHTRTLSEHLELSEFGEAALSSFLAVSGADGGSFCVVREGDLEVAAAHRMDPADIPENPTVRSTMTTGRSLWIDVPAGLTVDAGALRFRPAAIAILPITFRAVPVGVLVLAFARPPAPDTTRLVEALRSPTGVALNNALSHERFQRLAAVDPLTGAYNRRFGMARLQEEWARSVRTEVPLGLIGFDLDHFKAVNDTYGHLTGDRVLRDTTNAARLVLRDGDVLVRTGGEEFLVVLPGAGPHDVAAVGERIRRAVGAVSVASGDSLARVTVSLGAASVPSTPVDTPDDLVAVVDEAMYAAKAAGRDRLTMVVPPLTPAQAVAE